MGLYKCWSIVLFHFPPHADFKVVVLIVLHSLHTVAAHTFTVGTVICWIPSLKNSQTEPFPTSPSCLFVPIFTLLLSPSPPSLPLYAVSFGVAPRSAALPKTSLCRRGSIPIPHIAVAWASFTDPVDWQCECPGLTFRSVPRTFSAINHGRRKTCQS